MTTHVATYRHVDELKQEFEQQKDAIRRRLAEFSAIRPEAYFYELAYCLLTPQSSAANAGRAIEALQAMDLERKPIDPAGVLREKTFYIRFHNTKADHLLKAKSQFPEIAGVLLNGQSSQEIRLWLVHNVAGLGWKEASHFLRNIGHRDLAILDRHILKNLKKHNVLRTLPKSLTPGRYLAIEARFRNFAGSISIAMDELDLLFWSRETGEILK